MIILTVKGAGSFNAGPKAPSDIIEILTKKYNAESVLLVQGKGIIGKIKYRKKIFSTILKSKKKDDVLVLQFPMYETTKLLNRLFLMALSFANKDKTVVLIHDLDSIRSEDEILKKQEFDRLSKIKYIIAHNERMSKYLKEIGLTANIYNLDLFDYICDKKENYERKNAAIDSKSLKVAYAGNLVKVKSPYLYQLDKDKMNFYINLYGVGIENDINERLIYKGKYPPNELPDKIEANLGLIWDGNFDESDENTGFKKYTKYNNPHKLSCYVAAGLPVIVWKKAAIADFVNKYNIGYTISKIYDINELDLSDYDQKLANIAELQKKARNGEFTIKVFDKVLKDMEENNK